MQGHIIPCLPIFFSLIFNLSGIATSSWIAFLVDSLISFDVCATFSYTGLVYGGCDFFIKSSAALVVLLLPRVEAWDLLCLQKEALQFQQFFFDQLLNDFFYIYI